jgi:hypothetical protein
MIAVAVEEQLDHIVQVHCYKIDLDNPNDDQ